MVGSATTVAAATTAGHVVRGILVITGTAYLAGSDVATVRGIRGTDAPIGFPGITADKPGAACDENKG